MCSRLGPPSRAASRRLTSPVSTSPGGIRRLRRSMPRPVEACPADRGRSPARSSPIAASAVPRLIAVVVLPTPPFWLASASARGATSAQESVRAKPHRSWCDPADGRDALGCRLRRLSRRTIRTWPPGSVRCPRIIGFGSSRLRGLGQFVINILSLQEQPRRSLRKEGRGEVDEFWQRCKRPGGNDLQRQQQSSVPLARYVTAARSPAARRCAPPHGGTPPCGYRSRPASRQPRPLGQNRRNDEAGGNRRRTEIDPARRVAGERDQSLQQIGDVPGPDDRQRRWRYQIDRALPLLQQRHDGDEPVLCSRETGMSSSTGAVGQITLAFMRHHSAARFIARAAHARASSARAAGVMPSIGWPGQWYGAEIDSSLALISWEIPASDR